MPLTFISTAQIVGFGNDDEQLISLLDRVCPLDAVPLLDHAATRCGNFQSVKFTLLRFQIKQLLLRYRKFLHSVVTLLLGGLILNLDILRIGTDERFLFSKCSAGFLKSVGYLVELALCLLRSLLLGEQFLFGDDALFDNPFGDFLLVFLVIELSPVNVYFVIGLLELFFGGSQTFHQR